MKSDRDRLLFSLQRPNHVRFVSFVLDKQFHECAVKMNERINGNINANTGRWKMRCSFPGEGTSGREEEWGGEAGREKESRIDTA